MKLKSYFKNLPDMWSANIIAMLGFVSFVLAIIAAAASSYYSVDPFSFPKTFQDIYGLMESCIIIHIFLFPLTCAHAIVPIIVQCIFLSKPKLQNNIIFIIMMVITILCTIPGYDKFDSSHGEGIYFAFLPIFGSPVTIITFIILFILFYRDLKNKKQIPDSKHITNSSYINFVNIFFWYGIVVLILETLLLIDIFLIS